MNPLSYNASFHIFSDNSDIEVNPKTISTLLETFSEFGLVPNIGQQINGLTGEKKKVIRMVSDDGSLYIEFPTNRLVISLTSENQFSLSEFKDTAIKMLNKLQKIDFTKKASRISVVTNKTYALNDLSESSEIYEKLFSDNADNLIEWEFRKVVRDSVSTESINNVLRVHSGEGMNPDIRSGRPFNFVNIEVDTNTFSENQESRFALDDLDTYLSGIIDKNDSLAFSVDL